VSATSGDIQLVPRESHVEAPLSYLPIWLSTSRYIHRNGIIVYIKRAELPKTSILYIISVLIRFPFAILIVVAELHVSANELKSIESFRDEAEVTAICPKDWRKR
jgi:hypothetical protein